MMHKTHGQLIALATAKPRDWIRVMHYGEIFLIREIITVDEERAKELGAPVGSLVLVID